jgi:hypothetical protein
MVITDMVYAEIRVRIAEHPPAPAPVVSPTTRGTKAQMDSQTINPMLLEVEGAREP